MHHIGNNSLWDNMLLAPRLYAQHFITILLVSARKLSAYDLGNGPPPSPCVCTSLTRCNEI